MQASNGERQVLRCLFTSQLTKKRKTWQDGAVRCCAKRLSVTLYKWSDTLGVTEKTLGELFLNAAEFNAFVTQKEPELEMEKYLVTLEGVTENTYASNGDSQQSSEGVGAAKKPKLKGWKAPTKVTVPARPSQDDVYERLRRQEQSAFAAAAAGGRGGYSGGMQQRAAAQAAVGNGRCAGAISNGFGRLSSLWDDESADRAPDDCWQQQQQQQDWQQQQHQQHQQQQHQQQPPWQPHLAPDERRRASEADVHRGGDGFVEGYHMEQQQQQQQWQRGQAMRPYPGAPADACYTPTDSSMFAGAQRWPRNAPSPQTAARVGEYGSRRYADAPPQQPPPLQRGLQPEGVARGAMSQQQQYGAYAAQSQQDEDNGGGFTQDDGSIFDLLESQGAAATQPATLRGSSGSSGAERAYSDGAGGAGAGRAGWLGQHAHTPLGVRPDSSSEGEALLASVGWSSRSSAASALLSGAAASQQRSAAAPAAAAHGGCAPPAGAAAAAAAAIGSARSATELLSLFGVRRSRSTETPPSDSRGASGGGAAWQVSAAARITSDRAAWAASSLQDRQGGRGFGDSAPSPLAAAAQLAARHHHHQQQQQQQQQQQRQQQQGRWTCACGVQCSAALARCPVCSKPPPAASGGSGYAERPPQMSQRSAAGSSLQLDLGSSDDETS